MHRELFRTNLLNDQKFVADLDAVCKPLAQSRAGDLIGISFEYTYLSERLIPLPPSYITLKTYTGSSTQAWYVALNDGLITQNQVNLIVRIFAQNSPQWCLGVHDQIRKMVQEDNQDFSLVITPRCCVIKNRDFGDDDYANLTQDTLLKHSAVGLRTSTSGHDTMQALSHLEEANMLANMVAPVVSMTGEPQMCEAYFDHA